MSTRNIGIDKLAARDDVNVDISVKSVEDAAEKDHRLRKDRLQFYAKELGPLWMGSVVFFLLFLLCGWTIVNPNSPPAHVDKAWQIIAPMASGLIGVLFGKALGK